MTALAPRAEVLSARRVVVKVGSSSLTTAAGHLDGQRVDALAEVLWTLRATGRDVVLVSSGAIAAGLRPLGFERRPRDLATLQAAASVGQGLLVHRYAEAFARHGVTVAQVLLTAEDVVRRAHYLNARRTLDRLLALGAVPIINENDAVATAEITFGDNDRLAALVANLVAADLLVLLSDVDGLYDADPRLGAASLIDAVRSADELAAVSAGSSGSAVGSGGMASKVEAARISMASGVHAVVGASSDASAILAGEHVGTLFHGATTRTAARLLWLAHAATPAGRICLDDGAVRAVTERRVSLLPAGVTGVEGTFAAGDPVDLVDASGVPVARGFVNYASAELPALLGRSTRELSAALGPAYEREVVHRDDLTLL
ncbi:MAG TPA: glutamate 5-kinase [Mycobacteriales bacterium]|jgi:glutamate 5-kinase|nr:glutamate 5-kinase [Mycobacteriales bacterium]